MSEDNEGDDSCCTKYPYGKDEVMAAQKGSDFGSTGFSTNSLTVKVGLCIENGNNKHIHGMDDTKDGGSRGETSPISEDSANKRIDDRKNQLL